MSRHYLFIRYRGICWTAMVRHRTTNLQTFTFANFHLPQLCGFVIYFFSFSRCGCSAGN